MSDLVSQTPWWITVLVLTVATMCIGLLVRKWMHRTLSKEALRRAHEVSTAVYLNIGVLYGIVLGLVTVNGLDRHMELTVATEQEASSLLGICRMAMLFPDPEAKIIHSAVRTYAAHVINVEWTDDAAAQARPDESLSYIWKSLVTMVKADSTISPEEQQLFKHLDGLQETRMQRLGLLHEKINVMMWGILIGGGVLMVLFLVAFDPMSPTIHSILFATVSITIIMILTLIYSFDHPFDGSLPVTPTPYRIVLEHIAN